MKYAARIFISLAVVATAVFAWLIVREAGTQGNRALDRILPDTRSEVVQTFREYLASVRAAGGDELVVAEVTTGIELTTSDQRREWWTGLSLGTTTASVRAQVVCTYIIRLSDRWRLAWDGNVLWLRRPVVRPRFPPAIDSRSLELRADNGWLRWNRDDVRDRVLADLTPLAITRATEHLQAARPAAEQAIRAFASGWLGRALGHGRADVVLVDEIPGHLTAVEFMP